MPRRVRQTAEGGCRHMLILANGFALKSSQADEEE